jgi:hypothetical protein
MIDTNPFFQLLKGAASPSLAPNGNEVQPAWQRSLMESTDPMQAKRRAIANALLQGSKALVSTPGNFLAGVSQGAVAGADAYRSTRDAETAKRNAALKTIYDSGEADRNLKMRRIKDVLDAARGINKDATMDAYYGRLPGYRSGTKGGGRSGELNERERLDFQLKLDEKAEAAVQAELDARPKGSPEPTAAERAAMVEAKRQELYLHYGLPFPGGGGRDSIVPGSGGEPLDDPAGLFSD